MIAEMVIVVAGKQRENEATPQFAEVVGDIVAKLADAVSKHGVGTRIAVVQPQQAGCGDEGYAICSSAIKAGDDSDALIAHGHKPVFRDLNASLCRKRKREN